jgi:hypothetical protein
LQAHDAAFVEAWAMRHGLPGEQRLHGRYGVYLWERHYRVTYYCQDTHAPTRSFFITMVGDPKDLNLLVRQRQ